MQLYDNMMIIYGYFMREKFTADLGKKLVCQVKRQIYETRDGIIQNYVKK